MSRRIGLLVCLGVFATLLSGERSAAAQEFRGGYSVRNATRNFLFNRPTVSPYLNLVGRSSTSGLPRYQTLVRPQVEQQQQNLAQRQQSARMQEQINSVQNDFRQAQQQQVGVLMTGRFGWSSRGMPRHGSYLNFFPGFQRIPR